MIGVQRSDGRVEIGATAIGNGRESKLWSDGGGEMMRCSVAVRGWGARFLESRNNGRSQASGRTTAGQMSLSTKCPTPCRLTVQLQLESQRAGEVRDALRVNADVVRGQSGLIRSKKHDAKQTR